MRPAIAKGDLFTGNDGSQWEVVDYIHSDAVVVVSDIGTMRTVSAGCLRVGKVRDFMRPTLHGVGISGMCKITNKAAYSIWAGIVRRCYSSTAQLNRPRYAGCSVSDEWKLFPNFLEWYEANHVDGYQVDKDLLVPFNKVYSADTCLYVPNDMNMITVLANSVRGSLPVGVVKSGNRFVARISIKKKMHSLGSFATADEAFSKYYEAKVQTTIDLLDKYPEYSQYKEQILYTLKSHLLAVS